MTQIHFLMGFGKLHNSGAWNPNLSTITPRLPSQHTPVCGLVQSLFFVFWWNIVINVISWEENKDYWDILVFKVLLLLLVLIKYFTTQKVSPACVKTCWFLRAEQIYNKWLNIFKNKHLWHSFEITSFGFCRFNISMLTSAEICATNPKWSFSKMEWKG